MVDVKSSTGLSCTKRADGRTSALLLRKYVLRSHFWETATNSGKRFGGVALLNFFAVKFASNASQDYLGASAQELVQYVIAHKSWYGCTVQLCRKWDAVNSDSHSHFLFDGIRRSPHILKNFIRWGLVFHTHCICRIYDVVLRQGLCAL